MQTNSNVSDDWGTRVNNLPKVVTWQPGDQDSSSQPLSHKSKALPLDYQALSALWSNLWPIHDLLVPLTDWYIQVFEASVQHALEVWWQICEKFRHFIGCK